MKKFFAKSRLAVLFLGAVVAQDSFAAKLEEIIVTAQKREQSLQSVPVTVSAISEEGLQEYGVDDLFEVAALVPGMVFSRAPDDGLALTLRGLGTPARTQSFDQSVALFLDGMFLGKGRMYTSAFFDVDRIEVIKGTQSTLLGKNSSLGALSMTTRKPGDEFAGNVLLSREFENGGWKADAGVDIPFSEDFSVRLAAHYVDQDGWVKNVVTGKDVPINEELSFRATAVYNPTDSLSFTLSYQNSDNERRGTAVQYVDYGNYFSPEVLEIIGEAQLDDTKQSACPECPGNETFHDTEVDLASLTVNFDIGENTLTSITSFGSYEINFVDDFDFGDAFDEVTYAILNPGTVERYSTYFARTEDYDQFSQELRFASPTGGQLEYMAGLFYFDSDWESSEAQFWSTPNFPPDLQGQIFNGPFTNNFDQQTETWSTFAHVTLGLTEKLRGTVGLRYTDEEKDVVFERVQGTPVTVWNSVLNPPFDSPLEFDGSFLNGNLSLQYDATDDVMLYASYGVGSKTGGFAESAEVRSGDPSLEVADNGARVKTEEATTYELGAKMSLLDGAANLNIALFHTEVDDFQETSFQVTPAEAFFLTRNIDVESEGFEIDSQWQATDELRFSAGATYADTFNTDDNTELAQAPDWTGTLGVFYERSIGNNLRFSTSGLLSYRDDMVSQINETFPSDSLTSLDLNLSLMDQDEVWKLSLIGTNITDEVVADFSGPSAAPIGALFGAPAGDQGITQETLAALRTISLQLIYNF